MKPNRQNLILLASLSLSLTSHSVFAADLTWDTTSGDNPTITAGSGAWNTTGTNLVWNNNANPNVPWTQTSTTDGSNAAIFAGTDGTLDQYVVTLGSQMAAESITFNNSGYLITGSTLALIVTPTVTGPPQVLGTNGAITVATGKTAAINSILRYDHNRPATLTVNSGSVLNLGGGTTSGSNRPQWSFSGAGTVNLTAGAFAQSIGSLNNASTNLTGGSHTMTDQNGTATTNIGTNIGSNAGRDVAYTVSGTGTLNALASNDTTVAYTLHVGRNMGNFKSSLILQTGGNVNIGVTASRAGQINLGSVDGNSNSLLDVQGGTLTVGTGKATNKLYFFAAGANANKTATMAQSGGTSTLNGIQFGANTGDNVGGLIGANAYAADSSATLTLSGGNLYVGAQGITRGSAAAALPISIQLQGGTLGASQNWSSSLDMKLTAATIRAQDSGTTARDINISGVLSNDGAVAGTLTKTGSGTLTLTNTNTYTGATTVSAGALFVTGSLTSDVSVSDAAMLGGSGTVAAVSFAGGSYFDIAPAIGGNALDSTTTISFSTAGFGIDNLRFNGAAVDWSTIADDTYTLITGDLNETFLDNFGVANAFDIDGISGTRTAYFEEGSLNLVVIPEPRSALLGGLGLLALLRRRRG